MGVTQARSPRSSSRRFAARARRGSWRCASATCSAPPAASSRSSRSRSRAAGPSPSPHPDMKRYFMTIPEACQLVLQAGGDGRGRRDLRPRHGRAGQDRRPRARPHRAVRACAPGRTSRSTSPASARARSSSRSCPSPRRAPSGRGTRRSSSGASSRTPGTRCSSRRRAGGRGRRGERGPHPGDFRVVRARVHAAPAKLGAGVGAAGGPVVEALGSGDRGAPAARSRGHRALGRVFKPPSRGAPHPGPPPRPGAG